MDPDTVYKWRRRWAGGEWSLEDAPQSGRPGLFPPVDAGAFTALPCDRPTDDR